MSRTKPTPASVNLRLWLNTCALWMAAAVAGGGAGVAVASDAQVDVAKGGTEVFIMRHALAPGFGDPDNIQMGDCSTQRNLSEAGRAQASAAGDWLRSQGLNAANTVVLASPWCRTLETAELLQLGTVQSTKALASFFQQGSQAGTMAALATVLRNIAATGSARAQTVLVTHQVVISALTGRGVSSGEILRIRVASDGSFERIVQRHTP